jgi:hypothetical protein
MYLDTVCVAKIMYLEKLKRLIIGIEGVINFNSFLESRFLTDTHNTKKTHKKQATRHVRQSY